MLYTTTQLASVYQVSPRWIQRLCKRLGIRKRGRDYILDAYEAGRLTKELYQLGADYSIIDEYRGEDDE